MLEKVYLWIEDSKAGYIFWQALMGQLFPGAEVECKKNSSELVKAVKKLKDSDNKYVIILDNSFDNVQAVMEQKQIKRYIAAKHNIFLMDIICFEYILLEFKSLIKWIYAPDDEFLKKRAKAVAAREKLVCSIGSCETSYKNIKEIVVYDSHVEEHNIEQLSAKLLFELTRNTGFEVSKGQVGECWIKPCCKWEERRVDDICGLDEDRPGLYDKMKRIYEETSLKGQFQLMGLEVRP